jgi:O-methyltransferase
MIKKSVAKIFAAMGYDVIRRNRAAAAYESEVETLIDAVSPFTMTSRERMFALYQAVGYLHANKIDGDFVECGVWRGGSAMLTAMTLKRLGDFGRKLFLYDTFEGMSSPGEYDVDFQNRKMKDVWRDVKQEDTVMCYSTLEEVQQNMSLTQYPTGQIIYVQGKVEDTIPNVQPERIALLRLDTDWYESTLHELEHLYPRLVTNGVLIIDDYGHWKGARKAVDEYFKQRNIFPLLHAIDYTGRIMVKTEITPQS